MRRTFSTVIAFSVALICAALAQSPPNPPLIYGMTPTAAQWNSYFQQKLDYLGYTPCNPAGCTMTGRLVAGPSTSTLSGFNTPPGSTPSGPANGDWWVTSTGAYVRVGGVSKLISLVPGQGLVSATGVNFNSVADTQISPILPPGYTRYLVANIRINAASEKLTTSQVALYTGAAATGTTLFGATAVTVSTASEGTNNNSMIITPSTSNTQSYTLANYPILYFRVTTPQGSAATASVTLTYVPLP